MSNHILKYEEFILETTEFNLQRLNSDSVQVSTHVDNPSLSINAFDKHEDIIRQSISRLNGLNKSLGGTSAFKSLKSKLSLEDQDLKTLKIVRLVKNNNLSYDVYVSFVINEEEYWGVIENIMSQYPEFKSELFKDHELIQTKEWVIKIKGLIIKHIKEWMKPQFGKFRLVNDYIICYSMLTGKMIRLEKDVIIEVLKSYNDKIIFEYENDQYTLIGDNFIYFNWWFEPLE